MIAVTYALQAQVLSIDVCPAFFVLALGTVIPVGSTRFSFRLPYISTYVLYMSIVFNCLREIFHAARGQAMHFLQAYIQLLAPPHATSFLERLSEQAPICRTTASSLISTAEIWPHTEHLTVTLLPVSPSSSRFPHIGQLINIVMFLPPFIRIEHTMSLWTTVCPH